MKIFKLAIAVIALALTSISFLSCGSDVNDSEYSESSSASTNLVGTWYSSLITIQLNSNGTGYMVETGKTVTSSDYFTYVLDTVNKKITATSNGTSKTYTYTLSSNGNSLTIYGIDNDDLAVVTLTKQNVVISPVGTWYSSLITIQLNSNGTGYMVETGKAVTSSDYFNYVLDTVNKKITVTSNGTSKTYPYTLSSDGNSMTIYGIDNDDLAVVKLTRQ